MRTRYLLASVLVAFSLLISGCDSSSPGRQDQAKVQKSPTEADQVISVYSYGIVEARRHSTLSAKFPGKIEKILVQEGDSVKQGQVLARFEALELDAQVASAKAAALVAEAALAEALAGSRPQQLAAARERLKEVEAQLVKARADWRRYQGLHANAVIAPADLEQYRLKLESAEAGRNALAEQVRLLEEGERPESITVLKRRLDLARAEIVRAEAALANATLTAPYAGVITRKHREEGEALDIGLPVLDIATLNDRYVLAEIDETDIGRVRPGQAAKVTADGFPGLSFSGQVVEVKQQMGPKRLIPTDPSKIVDYKVLNVAVSLPSDCPYPIKLPVTVRIALGEKKG